MYLFENSGTATINSQNSLCRFKCVSSKNGPKGCASRCKSICRGRLAIWPRLEPIHVDLTGLGASLGVPQGPWGHRLRRRPAPCQASSAQLPSPGSSDFPRYLVILQTVVRESCSSARSARGSHAPRSGPRIQLKLTASCTVSKSQSFHQVGISTCESSQLAALASGPRAAPGKPP